MILKVRALLMAIILLVSHVPLNTAFALNDASIEASITQEIKDNSKAFDPEKVGNRLNEKGEELFSAVRSGSNFYIYLALAIFLILLIGGLFYKKLLSLAFLVLFLSIIGYLIINFWPQIFDGVMSILNWLFDDKGGANSETTPGV
ncbi:MULTISPECIES: hypothetical protein [Paenibacillus]|uniref:DUF4064 domain-containing protein n=1 Tax=Paenibacillus aceti TaxID=1820010 RepID=A0ABQ1W5T0_9BACL|nr:MULTISPECIES: hypothetical protein [Paenibacillus]KHF32059.1 hypothetical protein CM49_05727 [Paenibacillus sp. P1XP2]MDU0330491.1 hypothetical protein [Paenibacillus sp. 3LSP]GGG15216.1 hypothetical protein GCM10010913_41400 [Paenibacillus aceti]